MNQNFERNWLAVWDWQILTRILKSFKKLHFNELFLTKKHSFSVKNYRGVMFNSIENWCMALKKSCKIWTGHNSPFQNWHEKFEEFWSEHSKVSKICTLMGSFWRKYIIFELKKYREVMFGSTEDWCEIWSKTHLCFQKWHEEFRKTSQAEKYRFHFRK